jgi:transcriptional regulator with PAS, ATPase and Fis domain
MKSTESLPLDGQRILELAARSMFELFANASEGMLLVDRDARVVWINDQYKRFLPALGFQRVEDFVGHPVSDVVHNTQMHRVLETGKPILIDLLSNKAGTFVVSRIPLRDEAGNVIGALGIVLFDHPETTLQPLIHKFANLQRDLDDARRELATQRRSKYTLASFVGTSPEAEFFGTAPGAFTGADRKGRDGKFKLADGGTLFLDEIGDMPLALQPKLLRALQEGEIEPLGSNKVIPFDARVIAATSRDLGALVREGKFREDLYYRLNVLPIKVPPLRERRADIAALAEVLVEDIALRNGTAPFELSTEAVAMLVAQHWRGNTRELRNVLEQAAMGSDSQHIEAHQLEQVLREAGIERVPPAPPLPLQHAQPARNPLRPLAEQIAEVERQAIQAALEATGGNKVAAARLLGISRAKLYERLELAV